ncbi:MAG: 4-hydroxy-tetrahydrodipicolinate reductase [Planctomycetota bacterium]|jgi:4-hydroxy-tetrahydrodipicolinate reductase|nr:4-hydroxy-tetrahydrodipicolinate reductase [Planctomycetota bacterium]
MTVKLAISGSAGRMGRRLLALSDNDAGFELVQAIEWSGFPELGEPVNQRAVLASRAKTVSWTDTLAPGADVLVDFSTPENAMQNARRAVELGVRLVIGTTGLQKTQTDALKDAAKSVPVMFAPNYSLGVNLMFRLAAEAARVLGGECDIEIVEAHHNRKVDAPSGTALGIAGVVAGELGRELDRDMVHGRAGQVGKRRTKEIGMHALRMGSVTGKHTIYFCSEHECIEITHTAESRDVFAAGALRAAKWIMSQAPGLYDMRDMLFGTKR